MIARTNWSTSSLVHPGFPWVIPGCGGKTTPLFRDGRVEWP
jgi:hypothetical protein